MAVIKGKPIDSRISYQPLLHKTDCFESMQIPAIIELEYEQWLNNAIRCISPFYNDRPDADDISLLVIHCISLPRGCYRNQMVQHLFQGRLGCFSHPELKNVATLNVSAHLFIDRVGTCYQFVPFNRRAWHAGISCFEGVDNCNDYSIGIELEGIDDGSFTTLQYNRLVEVSRLLVNHYPRMTHERIVGHSDIAPERKTDPGNGFDWSYYRQQLLGNS
ncbi:MAG: 1,6-anhydro-N-acetylmuramyl-L-alanine amidase AmpD [Candidatus Celerinatantimonas neptuna]|nr:MAG: 1,6-anhydro-N-acetylmuramyl-L-alanine amidase AmpD [Candidatus Celerinatantimonas neptuna]